MNNYLGTIVRQKQERYILIEMINHHGFSLGKEGVS